MSVKMSSLFAYFPAHFPISAGHHQMDFIKKKSTCIHLLFFGVFIFMYSAFLFLSFYFLSKNFFTLFPISNLTDGKHLYRNKNGNNIYVVWIGMKTKRVNNKSLIFNCFLPFLKAKQAKKSYSVEMDISTQI